MMLLSDRDELYNLKQLLAEMRLEISIEMQDDVEMDIELLHTFSALYSIDAFLNKRIFGEEKRNGKRNNQTECKIFKERYNKQ